MNKISNAILITIIVMAGLMISGCAGLFGDDEQTVEQDEVGKEPIDIETNFIRVIVFEEHKFIEKEVVGTVIKTWYEPFPHYDVDCYGNISIIDAKTVEGFILNTTEGDIHLYSIEGRYTVVNNTKVEIDYGHIDYIPTYWVFDDADEDTGCEPKSGYMDGVVFDVNVVG